MKPRATAPISRPPLRRGRRRDQRHHRQPGVGEGVADVLGLAQRQVGDDRPGGAGGDARGGRTRPRRRGPGPCSRRPSAPPGPARRPRRQTSSAVRRVAPPSSAARRRGSGSSDRRRAGRRTAPRARSGRPPRRRRRRRPPAPTRGRGTRPSCTASARRGLRPSPLRRRRGSAPRRRSPGGRSCVGLLAEPPRCCSETSGPRPGACTRPGPCRRARRGRGRRSRRPPAGSPAARRSRARTPAPG